MMDKKKITIAHPEHSSSELKIAESAKCVLSINLPS